IFLLKLPGSHLFWAFIFLFFFIGLRDDLAAWKPLTVMLFESLTFLSVVLLGGFKVPSLGGIIGIEWLPQVSGYILAYLVFFVSMRSAKKLHEVEGVLPLMASFVLMVFAISFILLERPEYACSCI